MYSIHSCLHGQPVAEVSAERASMSGIDLHLQENRSALSQEARITSTKNRQRNHTCSGPYPQPLMLEQIEAHSSGACDCTFNPETI